MKTTVDWLREKDLNQRPSGYEVIKSFILYYKNSKHVYILLFSSVGFL